MRFSADTLRSLLAGMFFLASMGFHSSPEGNYVSKRMRHLTTCGTVTYEDLLRMREGTVVAVKHWVNMGGSVTAEVIETVDSNGDVATQSVVANIFGREAPIGRAVHSDSNPMIQYYVKNHLGSTMRVINPDGSFASTPVFDYQAYGKSQIVRDDSSNPAGPRFTGKELDPAVDLYYFGARWYDPDLAAWIGPDPANEFSNPYSYVGYSPTTGVDPNGLLCADVWHKNCRTENAGQIRTGLSIAGQLGRESAVDAGEWTYDNRDWITATAYFAVTGDAVGAFGIYQGLAIADAKGYGLTDWQTYAYAAGGYGLSTFSAAGGKAVGAATHSGTLGLAANSTLGSVGTHVMTGGKSDISTSFGAFSVNWTQGDVGYLGKGGNGVMDNLGYAMGTWGAYADAKRGYRSAMGYPAPAEKVYPEGSNWWGDNFTGSKNAASTVDPKNIRDRISWFHDRAYDALGIKGAEGLFTDVRGISADGHFVRDQMKTVLLGGGANGVTQNVFRRQTLIVALGFAAFAVPKTFASQNNAY
jgi:RHS repeat-associated protein